MTQITDRLTTALAGRYRIDRELGAGGMATVYLAEDLKHDRKVALKVLKPELAAVLGAERFVVEIKTTASLQHPHILPLFDSGTADGFLFYVMPFIKGETLRDKLNRETQLGVDEAVRITREVADALDYAHRNGVIHRDIKPENILMHDGRPMVADFGIALAVSAAAGGRMTETGLSLGTPHYMSPEQATADKEITGRSDVYSLASVLYEMLAGNPPHVGSSAQQIIMKIIAESAAPVTQWRKAVPPNVASALAKALEKLPADRFESAKEFAEALGNQTYRTASVTEAAATAAPMRRARDPVFLALAGVAVIAVLVAAGTILGNREATESSPATTTRMILAMNSGQEYSTVGTNRQARHIAISPDGRQVVYMSGAAVQRSARPLFRRRLNELESTPVAGTEAGFGVRWSRDGSFLAFSVDERVGVIPAEGGSPTWLGSMRSYPVWGDDDALYFRDDSTIQRWRPGSASAERLPAAKTPRVISDVLPGSGAVLLSWNGDMEALDLATGRSRMLGAGAGPRYLRTGHIAFVRADDGALMVQPFDLKTLTTTGPAVSTPDHVAATTFDIADDGSLIYSVSGVGRGERLAWVGRDGNRNVVDWIEPELYDAFALSPKGDALAAAFSSPAVASRATDIWVFDLAARTRLPLTRDGRGGRPRWHPTERRLVFVRGDSFNVVLRTMPADGSNPPDSVVTISANPADAIWSPDGKEFLIRMPGAGPRNIFRFTPGKDSTPVPFLNRHFQERNPAPSPDGKWLVYTSDQSNRDEVYAQPYPQGGAVVPVSTDGGYAPLWSRDGRELFFVGADGYLWAAAVTYDERSFRVNRRTRLFSVEGLFTDPHRQVFDVAPNGRFLFRIQPTADAGEQLVLVRNWVQAVTSRQ